LKNRLFVTLDIPNEVVDQIINYRNSIESNIKLKWEPNEKLHLTIKFIGDVESKLTDEISDELIFVKDFNSIKCSFLNFGFFYRDSKPSILWAGLKTDDALITIIDQINLRLEKFSIPIENNKFNPHITLLRIKNDLGNDFVNSFKNFTFKPLEFSTNSISLYKSELKSDGSRYFKIKNYKLKKLEK
jgi:2'-5' RNA ligase